MMMARPDQQRASDDVVIMIMIMSTITTAMDTIILGLESRGM